MDDERLLADGRHRVRHRQAAARAGRRQHPRRRDADVPQPLGEHPAKTCPRRGAARPRHSIRSSFPPQLADRARSALRPLREDLRALGRAGHQGAALLHRRLQNTSISKLVYDFISGFHRENEDGIDHAGERPPRAVPQLRRALATRLPRPNTLLIDSEQLESGDALDDNFRGMAADEIERFRREIVERTGDARAGENITDQELLREVMNTVGKPGQLGGAIRCVVSVSMLTEGWDANTVTHVLGVRAFGTQLLCEQVIGRALRRQSYDLNEEGLFNVEYADVFGIPFDFTAKPVVAPPQPPRETVQVKAVRPERDALEIRFPRVEGYRVELPEERLTADFNDDSILELTPGPRRRRPITRNAGIIGEGVDLNLEHLGDMRPSHAALPRSPSACSTPSGATPARSRSSTCSASSSASPSNGSTPASSARAAPIRRSSCIKNWPTWPASASPPASPARSSASGRSRRCSIPTIPTGSTAHVSFNTSKTDRWETDCAPLPRQLGHPRQRLGGRVLPRGRVASAVRAYVKNHNLGLEVPYRYGSETRKYLPDFIVLVDDGHGDDDLLHLVVEIKGYRREDAKEKKSTMETYWVPGVNNLGTYGRWAFAEFTEVYQIEADFKAKVESEFNKMIDVRHRAAGGPREISMAKKANQATKTVETLKHDEAKRKNIPTAEYQSVLQKERAEARPRGLRARATATSTRSSSGAARTSRTGATSSSTRRRSTSRRRSTPRC